MDARSARAALIVATEPVDAAGGLRGTLPFLGATLVEHQVRQAVAAGAGHAVVLVAAMPPALLAALDRLRRDGAAVEIARGIAEAADRIHPEETVLLIGDGCLARQADVARVAAAAAPALFVRAVTPDDGFERLDAAHRWAGLALVDGALVRRTATAPRDWDAQSTLLRRAMQAGAARIEAGDAPPRLLRESGPRLAVDPALLAASNETGGAWTRRRLFPPIDAPLMRLLGPRGVEPLWLALGATALGLVAAALAGFGLPAAGLGVFLVSGFVAAAARRLARLRLRRLRHVRALELARAGGGATGLGLVAWGLGQWGWPLMAAVAIAALAAGAREQAMLERRGVPAPIAAADADALGWAALAGWAAAGWPGAVAAAALYAALSFALVQDRVARTI